MEGLYLVSYFFGGAFLTNAVPHFVSGVMGEAFQSPFAKPPGQGLSSSTVNVLWGFFNIVVGYVLVWRIGDFGLRTTSDVMPFGLGILLVTHHVAEIIPEIERVVLLREGRILADGGKQEVLTAEHLSSLFGVPVRLVQHDGYFHLY